MHKGSDCDQTPERIQGGLHVGHDLGAESEEWDLASGRERTGHSVGEGQRQPAPEGKGL